MKYDLKEHPYLWALLCAFVLLAGSIALGYRYDWKVYAIIPIGLASLAVIILGYSFIKDLLDFEKKKEEWEKKEQEKKHE